MIVKIIIYYLILYGVLFGMRKIVGGDPVILGGLIPLTYIGSYLVLLGFEINTQRAKKANNKEIRKAAFWFSFWAGVGFGTVTTFYRGYPTFYYSLEQTFWVTLGCILWGVVIGAIGVGLSFIIIPILKHFRGNEKGRCSQS